MYYKSIYVITMLVMGIIMMFLAQKAKQKNTSIARALVRLTYSVIITVTASILAMLLPSEPVALFMQTLHYASTEWMLIFLLAFLEKYTNLFEGKLQYRMIFFISSGISSVILLLNFIFENIVTCTYVTSMGVTYRMFETIAPLYNIHEYFSYALALFCLIALIAKTIETIKFYRVKYFPAVIALFITLGMEGICSFAKAKLDYALFGYIWLAIFLIYYTIFFKNKVLISSTLSYAVSQAKNGVVCFDIDKKCVYINDVIIKLFPESTSYESFEELFGGVNTTATLSADYSNVIQKEHLLNGEIRNLEITFSRIRDDNGDYIGTSFYVIDKTEDIRALEKVHYAATHDELTGLYNLAGFNDLVSAQIKNVDECYIVASDIKDFKLINDIFGYKKGDEILIKFAEEMRGSLSQNAICGRINSDRFAFYIPCEEYDESVFEKAVNPVKALLANEHLDLCIHFGIYKASTRTSSTWLMYDHARIALLSIKNDYDKIISYYDAEIMQRIVREKKLVSEFDKALEEKQFKMFLQPQISSETKQIIGAEALVRWQDPIQGMISPAEFIPVYEKTGLIYKLDMFMWEQAVSKLKEWEQAGKDDLHISVNISPTDFFYIDVYETVVELVERYGINPANLKLEITESAFMNDPESQLLLIDKLKSYGFHVEIDDFGSGYSSLNMLKDMKADVLKIDMGFLRKTEADSRAKSIILSIIKLAQELEMVVVTEGVETIEQVNFLTEAGCDIFQGYYFDKPLPIEVFEEKYLVN